MTISMYQASAPRFANTLKNLSAILDKAQAHADARKIDPRVLTAARLYPDMFPMSRQVQSACDTAKGAVARLAGVEIPVHEDTEQTLEELKARIANTIAFINTVKPAQVDGRTFIIVQMRSTVRAVLSLLPPGGFGTTSSTFLCGDHPCAPAAAAAHASAAAIRHRASFKCFSSGVA